MQYTLPDGRTIDLQNVAEVNNIRDLGPDTNTISLSIIGFTIRMKDGESIQVTKRYHFCDWAQAKKDLEQIRKDILLMAKRTE